MGPEHHMNRRPSFREWMRSVWFDILTMAIFGAIALGVYYAPPAPTRTFPLTSWNGKLYYPQFALPMRNNIIPIWLAALLASMIPVLIILCMQTRIRSFWDANNAIMGLLYSLINAAVFQVFLKWLIGGLSPHFFSACKAQFNGWGSDYGTGVIQVMRNRTICRGDEKEINDALESFPSGHATAAFAGFIFLFLYLNAKLKVFSNYAPHMWKLTALYAPVLGATLIAGAQTIDDYHNWYDVVAGAIIGTVFAFSAYRKMYAAIWDFRFNHIPLPRGDTKGFHYGAGGEADFDYAVATRRAGWGTGYDMMSGAPGNGAGTGAGAFGSGAATLGGTAHTHGVHGAV